MRIWFPLAIFLSVAWLLLVSLAASRGGDNGGRLSSTAAPDAAGLLQESRDTMLGLNSFQLQLSSVWEGREVTYSVAWQSPDSFHVLYPVLVEESSSENPEPVITDKGLYEGIAIGDVVYGRQCTAEGEGCQAWQEGSRENIYVPVAPPEMEPFWTMELLGLMSDAEIVGQEDVEGVACTRIRGRANPMQAMVRSWRHAEGVRGPIYWGEECTTAPTAPGGQTQEDCHQTTLDEYIAGYEDSIRELDQNPLMVEAWIGRDDSLLRRLQFPQGEQPAEGSVTFSQFDEVTVQPPK